MRLADEGRSRGKSGKDNRAAPAKKWGDYLHFSPTKEEKVAIRELSKEAHPNLLLWLDKRMQDGFSMSLKWIEDREAIRAELRAPGEDRMLCPAIAAYHADAQIALCALWFADTVGKPNWADQRMTDKEAHNW